MKEIIHKKIEGRRHTWYIPVNVNNPLDHMHVSFCHDNRGYGGQKMSFLLIDGNVDTVIGPYHARPFGTRIFENDVERSIVDIMAEIILLGV